MARRTVAHRNGKPRRDAHRREPEEEAFDGHTALGSGRRDRGGRRGRPGTAPRTIAVRQRAAAVDRRPQRGEARDSIVLEGRAPLLLEIIAKQIGRARIIEQTERLVAHDTPPRGFEGSIAPPTPGARYASIRDLRAAWSSATTASGAVLSRIFPIASQGSPSIS
jgi:hypothetical protein